MRKKPKLLILAHDQFGYSVTKFKHCEFARDTFDITYMGWDYGLPRIVLPKVKVKYISRKSNILVRNLRLLKAFHEEIRIGYDIVFMNYVRFISTIKVLNFRTKTILHIDTLGVQEKKYKRFLYDFLLMIESCFFKHIALINAGIAKKIHVKKYYVLPLGGECFSTKEKTFDRLSLLYVGTLTNRNILKTVVGFHRFIEISTEANKLKPKFVIIGDGMNNELKEIREYITTNHLEDFIDTTGFISQDQLSPFFEKANIGVSFVPITPYYKYQPPTKTFEYLISGLPVIATATEANKEIVTSSVSELIEDNAASFCKALVNMEARKFELHSGQIRREYSKYTWENIVREKFVVLIQNIVNS